MIDEPWRVRVRSRSGEPLGAGVLLDREHVLTCAHVALAADELAVDLVGLDGQPSTDARIADGLCVPPTADDRGDVAVLKLKDPQPDGIGAVLRQVALTWDRPVHALGYPHGNGLEIGVWARMTLSGRAGAEWLQMNRRNEVEQRVRAGFSGAGVADDQTREVLGIVVSEYTDEAAGLSWMLPVQAIVSHLPAVQRWVVGDSGIDPIFTAQQADPVARVMELADWLRRRDEGAAVLIVVGADLAAVRQAVALSATAPTADVDLALDVAGRTAAEVAQRIVDRIGFDGTPPLTIVVDGIDEAEEPEALLDDVLKPLVDSGSRLVLGFRDEHDATLAAARTLADHTVTARLIVLGTRISALASVDRQRATQLRVRLNTMRRAAAEDSAKVASRLHSFERTVTSAEQAAAAKSRRSDATKAELGLLQAWHVKAYEHDLHERIELEALHDYAYRLLTTEPVDLTTGHAAVRAYQNAVRHALKEDRG